MEICVNTFQFSYEFSRICPSKTKIRKCTAASSNFAICSLRREPACRKTVRIYLCHGSRFPRSFIRANIIIGRLSCLFGAIPHKKVKNFLTKQAQTKHKASLFKTKTFQACITHGYYSRIFKTLDIDWVQPAYSMTTCPHERHEYLSEYRHKGHFVDAPFLWIVDI